MTTANPPLSRVSLIFACGTALFSDGYANGIIGTVQTILKVQYGKDVVTTRRTTILSSLSFAGIVLGMLVFGYLSDKIGRKFGMMSATSIVAVFTLLSAFSKGAHGSIPGLLSALSAYRFLVGIGIGAEYPCGSVAASEQSEEDGINKRAQHRWFTLATNSMIDFGFVTSAFVPLVLYWIFGPHRLNAVWRGSLGLGVIPAVAVFIWRLKMEEPTRYKTDSMKNTTVPYLLILRRYWVPLVGVSVSWFIYDFVTYPFDLYSSTVVSTVVPADASLATTFVWNVVITLFYIPGTILGAFVVDYLGPKHTMVIGLLFQALFGFILSGLYAHLRHHIAGFSVLYGIFLTFGEFGPGNCLGLIAAKSGPTAVRGQFYGIAAAIGKIGAFAGTWAFPPMVDAFGGPSSDRGNSGPFFVGSGLALLSALITLVCVRSLDADGMMREDREFRGYLTAHGYDVSRMGVHSEESSMLESNTDLMDPTTANEKPVT